MLTSISWRTQPSEVGPRASCLSGQTGLRLSCSCERIPVFRRWRPVSGFPTPANDCICRSPCRFRGRSLRADHLSLFRGHPGLCSTSVGLGPLGRRHIHLVFYAVGARDDLTDHRLELMELGETWPSNHIRSVGAKRRCVGAYRKIAEIAAWAKIAAWARYGAAEVVRNTSSCP